ncbi:transcriptional regulator [Prauserella marina]|uniref:DNA-binding transcriptional regulator, AcrR family n=1 Tax=Prauserella marina TaxID=530584 RepID=A0A222VS81_9PSEU|nr:TetR/AcrR family transcriptional regulator [Prauserella marina]ASR36764.1 transcriptional regulator [Prauserella marina]PWV80341.1 TetR family transcriptional regulator [Prauserella marina]SDD52182.1 DNA-binding transcriptional regulator, AcrR family [Prauserella marina]
MTRLTRVQQRARTRAMVLAAARQEFVEYGYAVAKIDRIAERAELTRGAVYSNFPGKRALYLAVLVELAGTQDHGSPVSPEGPAFASEVLGAFARTWLERLPLAGEGRPRPHSLTGVIDDDHGRLVLTQLAHLEALLLALALEAAEPSGPRRVRVAELALTSLNGASAMAELAPGFGDPFDHARAVEHLASLDLGDTWAPAHLPYVEPATPCRDAWTPPARMTDQITGESFDVAEDGVVVVLGAARLSAAEEAVRAAKRGERVTVAVVTGDPANTGALVRLRIGDLVACLRGARPSHAWDGLKLVVDDHAAIAAAAGVDETGDETEAAVRVHERAIVARSRGRGGAGHAAATAEPTARSRGASA